MDGITIPKGGLVLGSPATDDQPEHGPNMAQIMQLDLEDAVLDEILKSSRHGGRGLYVSCGKTISLQYGTKSRKLAATGSSSHARIYSRNAEDKFDLDFAGRLSHKLAMQKAQEDIAGADEALAKLQNSLASAKQAKQSNQIKYVPDSSSLPPPIKQTAATLKHHTTKSSLSYLKNHRHSAQSTSFATRSMPTSPSLGADHSSIGQRSNPTSHPPVSHGKSQKHLAIRPPLLHLLAIRPLSAKYLAQNLRCTEDEVVQVLEKVGKRFRLDAAKWDLSDRSFKELDVWSFAYPDQHDRQLAIDRSASAFDRLRLSQEDPIWQKLYPKSERGKGKTLSNLNHLHKGPIQQGTTPRIHVQNAEDANASQPTEYESDQKGHLTPGSAEPMVRSRSNDQIKKTKISEKEAQSKRLLSKGPKRAAPAKKEKEGHPAVKKGVKKDTKKDTKKAPAPKSSEFVNDSDEEDGFEDSLARESNAPIPKATAIPKNPPKPAKSPSAAPTQNPSKPAKSPSAAPTHNPSKPAKSPSAAPTQKVKSAAPKIPRSLPKSQSGASTPMKGVGSKTQQPSTPGRSPHPKPRPLHGVSSAEKNKELKANTAEKDKELKDKELKDKELKDKELKDKELKANSTKDTANVGREDKTPLAPKAPEKKPMPSTSTNGNKSRPPDASQGGVAMEKSLSRQRNTSSPHKPSPLGSSPPANASDFDYPLHSSSSSTPMIKHHALSNGVTRAVNGNGHGHSHNISSSLKRRAADFDSDFNTNSSPLANGYTDGQRTGQVRSTKRQKTSEPTPPSSTSGTPPSPTAIALDKAQAFKDNYFPRYEKFHRKVSAQENPSADDLDKLDRMHKRLIVMKKEIAELYAARVD